MPELTKSRMKIAIKLCGHCNMRFDMTEIVDHLKKTFPEVEFSYYSRDPDADLLLILNACPAGCAKVPDYKGTIGIFSVGYEANHLLQLKHNLTDQIEGWIKMLRIKRGADGA